MPPKKEPAAASSRAPTSKNAAASSRAPTSKNVAATKAAAPAPAASASKRLMREMRETAKAEDDDVELEAHSLKGQLRTLGYRPEDHVRAQRLGVFSGGG